MPRRHAAGERQAQDKVRPEAPGVRPHRGRAGPLAEGRMMEDTKTVEIDIAAFDGEIERVTRLVRCVRDAGLRTSRLRSARK